MFGICLLVFIGLCIYHASEKEYRKINNAKV